VKSTVNFTRHDGAFSGKSAAPPTKSRIPECMHICKLFSSTAAKSGTPPFLADSRGFARVTRLMLQSKENPREKEGKGVLFVEVSAVCLLDDHLCLLDDHSFIDTFSLNYIVSHIDRIAAAR